MRTIALLLTCASLLSAQQSDSSRSLSSVVSSDVAKTLAGLGDFVTSPLRFDGTDWLTAGGVLAGAGLLMTQDRAIHDRMNSGGRESYNGDLWDVPTAYGDFAGAGGLAAALYGVGLATESENLRVTGRLIVESIAAAGLSALTIRVLSGRSRPFAETDPWHFRPIGWIHDHQSFPSGHTTTAFALSAVLAERIGTPWARIGLYSLGALTASARVRNNQHWPSDVALGAVLGITAGIQAVRREERRNDGGEGTLRILPRAGGLTLVYMLR
jgi:membrane-associated phospholipid phosphatase